MAVSFSQATYKRAFRWTAMTPERFLGHLRDWSLELRWVILAIKDHLELWVPCLDTECADFGLSPETTQHVVEYFAVAEGFWCLVSHVFYVTTAVALASRCHH